MINKLFFLENYIYLITEYNLIKTYKTNQKEVIKMPEYAKSNVFFSGFNDLDRYDQRRIKEIIYSKTQKLERDFKNLRSLRIHFKKYEEGGSVKYSAHLLIDGPTKPIAIDTKTANWDAVLLINRIFDKAKVHLAKKFKNYQRPRALSKKKLAALR